MEQPYEDRLADLPGLSDEELSALETDIVASFDEADEADDLDGMTAAADALDVVRAEKARRATEAPADETAAEVEETPTEVVAAAAAESEVADDGGSMEDTTPAPEATETPAVEAEVATEAVEAADTETPEVEAEAPAEVEAEADEETTEAQAPEVEQDNAEVTTVIADNTIEGHEEADVEIPEDRKPIAASAVRVTAGADIPGYSAGTEFGSVAEVNKAFVNRINSLKRVTGGSGEQHVVATLVASVSDDRTLDSYDSEANWAKIAKVVSPQAITASGGFCAPLDVRYEIFGLGGSERPLRDGLPGFNASRGGIRFVTPPVLGDLSAAVGLWDAATDADPQSATKPSLKVTCSAEDTAEVEAVTLTLEFGNLMSRAYPELVQRNNELGLIEHARLAERTLFSKMVAASTDLTSAYQVGTARDFLLALGRAAAAYRGKHRMDVTQTLRVVLPSWLRDAMREDIAQGLPGDRLGETDAIINGYIAARNVNVTWYLDDVYPASAVVDGAIPDFPSSIKWLLFAEGSFLFLDGGTLDLGVVRDSDLVGTNDYKTFVETFEGLAFIGADSWSITSTTAVTGSLIGTTEPTAPAGS